MLPKIAIKNTQPHHADGVTAVIYAAYNYDPQEAGDEPLPLNPQHIQSQIERFPEGQFVAELDQQVVGQASTMRTNYGPDARPLPWLDAIGNMNIANHEPDGEWLYGVEFTVHPGWRKLGIGKQLYQARFDLIKRLNLRGFIIVGMLMGYKNHRQKMSVREYGELVIASKLKDPTVTMQMNNGFRPVAVVEDYLDEPDAGNAGVLQVWENPHYRP